MASVTKHDEQTMTDDERDDDRDERPVDRDDEHDDDRDERRGGGGGGAARPPVATAVGSGGFFHIYKKGQGYWTRMGTAAAAGLIIVGVAAFMYENLTVWFPYFTTHRGPLVGVVLVVAGALALLAYWLMNKAGNVDFLIATDSEMKKVNWTSRRELIGSTKIVIIFVVLISAFLFAVDIIFGYLFYWFRVLETPPF